MGKKKIQIIDDFANDEVVKKPVKMGRKDKPIKKLDSEQESDNQVVTADEVKPPASQDKVAKKETKPNQAKPGLSSGHSKKYQAMAKKVDRTKLYPLKEALELLLKLTSTRFDETVELHLVTAKEKMSGEVKLPYGTGKTRKIVIFDDKVLAGLEAGKTDFDLLVARPSDMPKLAKYAKILGPKGLFPNPKNGTITNDPAKTVQELSGGKTYYKTEVKFPLIHFTVGKVSFGSQKLQENIKALLKVIGSGNIKKITLSSTRSPGIKLQVS